MSDTNQPTTDEVRQARHQGFVDAVGYMPEETKTRVGTSYATQDARREHNISDFVSKATGQ